MTRPANHEPPQPWPRGSETEGPRWQARRATRAQRQGLLLARADLAPTSAECPAREEQRPTTMPRIDHSTKRPPSHLVAINYIEPFPLGRRSNLFCKCGVAPPACRAPWDVRSTNTKSQGREHAVPTQKPLAQRTVSGSPNSVAEARAHGRRAA